MSVHSVPRNAEAAAERLLEWYASVARDLPWRRTRDPYGIWVSEIMLQQTQVRTVIAYWERWMRQLPDVAALARADLDDVLKLWEGLGYYRRVRSLHAAARQVQSERDGQLPRTVEEWLTLPGIGRYTAGAIVSIAFNEPAPILDGNVMRVLTRWGALAGDPTKGPLNRELWSQAEGWVREAEKTGRRQACSHFNQALMELGATVCLPRQPLCLTCPARSFCAAGSGGRAEEFPQTAARPEITARQFLVIVARQGERVCLRRRPDEGVNGGFWEFPNAEVAGSEGAARGLAERWFGPGTTPPVRLGQVKHSITRYRITQEVYGVEVPEGAALPTDAGEWVDRAALERLPLTRAHRRMVAILGESAARAGRKIRR